MLKNNQYSLFSLAALSILAVLFLFLWQGHKGFNLGDEGYLWYGVQRVMLGEVPMRDFMAYDPGRYYWSAALMSVVGDNGIISLRASVAVFQVLGLFIALLVVAQSIKSYTNDNLIFLGISVIILLAWMFPRHKLFDISLSIFLIGILTYLIQNPIPKRYFIAGLFVGIAAVFGRNHGVYGVIGSISAMLWLSIKPTLTSSGLLKNVTLWGVGVALGFSPILLMILLVPEFANSFWESVRFLFEVRATNISLPVPWPWAVSFANEPIANGLRSVLVGIFFVGTLSFAFVTIVWIFVRKLNGQAVQPALAATAFLALPYAHYAFSRADVSHLAQGIFPLILGCLVLLSRESRIIKWPLAISLMVASLWVTYPSHPAGQCLVSTRCVSVQVSGSTLEVTSRTANDIALLRQLADKYAPLDQSLVVVPLWPGAYSLLERKAPMWEIFPLWPRSAEMEKKEIERIKTSEPAFVLIFDKPLDGRDDLRFKNTHPLIYQYILDDFGLVSSSTNPPYQVYISSAKK